MMNLSIVIPTRNRHKFLKKTLKYLYFNKFFFNEVLVVDSSNENCKLKVIKLCKFFKKKMNIKFFNSNPSTAGQRNIGLKKAKKNNTYIMFLDDDIIFYKNSLLYMYKYLIKRPKNIVGIGFNLQEKKINNLLTLIKKNKIFSLLGIYSDKFGVVTRSGWQTKAINLKENTIVEWLSTQASIYFKKKIKNLKFNESLGKYSYLEDLYFSYGASKLGKLIILKNAKYKNPHLQTRNNFMLGFKEINNRYFFVNKYKLSKFKFFLGTSFLMSTNFLKIILFKKNFFSRFLGNFIGVINIFKIINKSNLFLKGIFQSE